MNKIYKTNKQLHTLCCSEVISSEEEVEVIFELSTDNYIMIVHNNVGHKIDIEIFNKIVILEDVDDNA